MWLGGLKKKLRHFLKKRLNKNLNKQFSRQFFFLKLKSKSCAPRSFINDENLWKIKLNFFCPKTYFPNHKKTGGRSAVCGILYSSIKFGENNTRISRGKYLNRFEDSWKLVIRPLEQTCFYHFFKDIPTLF
jgi:hypothetical protein